MGAVYVTVTADSANGIMTLDASGGGTGGNYWISWTNEGGFTGTGWKCAWESQNVPLSSAWQTSPAQGYDNTYEGFLKYVNTGVSNLSQWLDNAGWSNDEKYKFAHDEHPYIWMNCTMPG